MNNDWIDFLTSQGATLDDEHQASFAGSSDASSVKMPLTHLGIIKITGEDKQTFLQGQLTNDTRNISASDSQLSSYCTPKGRMMTSFRIFSDIDNNWYIVIPLQSLESTLKRLRMFVLMSKVELTDVTDSMAAIGLEGDITSLFDKKLPDKTDQTIHENGISLIRVTTHRDRYMAVGQTEAVQQLWQKAEQANAAGTLNWRLADIEDGIPNVFESTREAFIPQMTNLQLINGVSFTKGCYTGQEVVARMQYLGKLKRRMYSVSFDHDGIPQPGDDIFSSTSSSGQGAGKLVDVIATGNNHFKGLAVLEISGVENGEFHLYDDQGPALQVSPPPYEFEQDEQS